jgi:hypothetical protein
LPESAVSFQTNSAEENPADTLAQSYGMIHFEVEPDTAFIYLDRDYDRVIKVIDGDSLRLTTGFHNLLIFAKDLPERRINIRVQESEKKEVAVRYFEAELTRDNYSTYAAYRWGANLMVITDDETAITVEGTNYFTYGVLKAKLPPGAYRLRFERPSGKTYREFVEVTPYELLTVEEYFRPRKNTVGSASVIPGAAQFIKREPLKAVTALALVGTTLGATIHYNSELAKAKDQFYSLESRYQESTTEQVAFELGNQLDEANDRAMGIKRRRNIFRAAAVIFYIANLYDAFQEPDGGFAEDKAFNPYRDFSFDINSGRVEASIQFNF